MDKFIIIQGDEDIYYTAELLGTKEVSSNNFILVYRMKHVYRGIDRLVMDLAIRKAGEVNAGNSQ